jgi:hypothetical protein
MIIMDNTDNNKTVTDGMRNELWSIRDALTAYQTKHGCAANMGGHYLKMHDEVDNAAHRIDEAIYALNVAIAHNECGTE